MARVFVRGVHLACLTLKTYMMRKSRRNVLQGVCTGRTFCLCGLKN